MIYKTLMFCFLLEIFGRVSSNCIWYGRCNIDEKNRVQNCPYNGTAKPADNETEDILRTWCPHMLQDGQAMTCCDTEQIRIFSNHISQAKVFVGRCPSCFQSFVKLFCELTCSKDQSDFMKVKSIEKNVNGTDYINAVEVFVSETYINSTYEACRQVSFPASGQLVLDLMCGSWGANQCSPKRWYKFMGSPVENEYTPFEVDFVTELRPNSPNVLLNLPTFKCNESVDIFTAPCSCIDCEQSCPVFFNYEISSERAKNTFFIYEYNAVIFLCGVIFVGLFCFKTFPKRKYLRVKCLIDDKKSGSAQNDETTEYSNENDVIIPQPKVRDVKYGKFEHVLVEFLTWMGKNCATHPWKILCCGLIMVSCLSCGIMYVEIVTNPVELWASSTSQCRQERQYFNENFGPFYRIQQIIVSSKGLKNFIHNTSSGGLEFGPVFHEHFLRDIQKLQNDILKLGKPNDGLEKICFSPFTFSGKKPPRAEKCLIQSVFGYFKTIKFDDYTIERGFNVTYLDQISKCVQNMFNPFCLAHYGGPIDPAIAFGGFLSKGEILSKSSSFIKAKSLIITILINNYQDNEKLQAALKWEKLFLDFMKNWTKHDKPDYIEVSYFSERAVEDEIDRESQANVLVVLLSYLAMFAYVALMLGNFRFNITFLLESKIVLGLSGVIIVFSSVISSIGLNSLLGIKVTLIALEVIPFLVLAIGVDNIFILVRAFEQSPMNENDKSVEEYIGKILGKVGPSILLAGSSESACFFLGSLSEMPCIKAFALYAAVAVLMNMFLQLTCFVSLLSLDYKRKKNNKLDIFCCVQVKPKEYKPSNILLNIFSNYCTPTVLHKITRPIIMIFFALWLLLSISVLPKLELGLDQELGMPSDSFLLPYFQDLGKFLAVGPPVYFVVTNGLDLTNTSVQNTLCSGQYCNIDSVTNQIYAASRHTNITYISKHPSSWIDDFFDWSTIADCCKITADGSFCKHSNEECDTCNVIRTNDTNRPIPSNFKKYLPFFLEDNPDEKCAKAGHAAYAQAVNYTISDDKDTQIKSFNFMAYHSVLKTSKDYYSALREARNLAENITRTIRSRVDGAESVKVFPYSVFYIYYEQYLTIWKDALKNVGISLITIFLACLIFTFGNITASLVILITVTIIIVDLIATMYFLNIQLNALSLINIVMSIGIAVEFCCHIVHHFTKSSQISRIQRSKDALNEIGSSVFSGVTLTKFIGISILGFSISAIFRIFYFQMYMAIVIIGALHGIIFLPVLLSYFGPMKSTRPLNRNNSSLN